MPQQEVYRTEVECSIGFSIQSPDGSWEKSNVSIRSQVGPGYPSKEMMSYVVKSQMDDAVSACEEQIKSISDRIVSQVGLGNASAF